MVSKYYGTYYRCWIQEIHLNNDRLGGQYPGLLSGLHHWRDGFLRAYFYFDDLLLLNEYYPCALRGPVGTSWHLHKTPPTIYATAKAILQLCPYMPTTPLSDFRNLNSEQQSAIYQEIEDNITFFLRFERGNATLAERRNLVTEVLAHGAIRFEPSFSPRDLPIQTFLVALVCRYQVVASLYFYANFPSIDKLRQDLLNRHGWRDRSRKGIPPEKATGSWEGGTPVLHRLPDDEDTKGLFDIYTEENYVYADNEASDFPIESDSSIGSLFDESE